MRPEGSATTLMAAGFTGTRLQAGGFTSAEIDPASAAPGGGGSGGGGTGGGGGGRVHAAPDLPAWAMVLRMMTLATLVVRSASPVGRAACA
ncbi:MAG: hypothetical protein Q7R30_04725 [Acidobacteriota bacterium]|nr:hypothetical protein [Acidobacteriota bacterium]